MMNPEKIEQGLLAYIRVGTYATTADNEQNDLEQFVNSEPHILECHDVDGEDSYLLKVRVDSLLSLRRLISHIRGLPSVNRTVSSISLKTIKESGLASPIDLSTAPPH